MSCGTVDGFVDFSWELAAEALEQEISEGKKTTLIFDFISTIEPGCLITVTGVAPYGTDRFSLDIYSQATEVSRDDIAFHFNPRLTVRYVVRNCYKSGLWGKEETTSFRAFPFEYDQPFRIEVLAAETMWLIAVDGEMFCEFKYRMPLNNIERLEVVGLPNPALTVAKTDFFPIPKEKPLKVPHFDNEGDVISEIDWPLHTRALLPQGIPINHQLVVRGRLRKMPHSFIIELTDGIQEWPHVTTCFHLNPRLSVSSHKPRQLVVLNTWSNGTWGVERKQETGKFIGGTEFEIRILRDLSHWTVWCGTQQIGGLGHRLDPETVKAVRIKGDFYPSEVYTIPASSSLFSEELIPKKNQKFSEKTEVDSEISIYI